MLDMFSTSLVLSIYHNKSESVKSIKKYTRKKVGVGRTSDKSDILTLFFEVEISVICESFFQLFSWQVVANGPKFQIK